MSLRDDRTDKPTIEYTFILIDVIYILNSIYIYISMKIKSNHDLSKSSSY